MTQCGIQAFLLLLLGVEGGGGGGGGWGVEGGLECRGLHTVGILTGGGSEKL